LPGALLPVPVDARLPRLPRRHGRPGGTPGFADPGWKDGKDEAEPIPGWLR